VKRYPPFDPPEYVDFRPDPAVQRAYRDTVRRHPRRRRIIEGLDPARLLRLYAGMVRFRLHDITLKRWVRQGILSKAWLGTGEEAVTVGAVHALRPGDCAGPMIRNAGAGHEMGMPVAQLLKAYLGTADQITRGRDLHTGDPDKGVIPPTSMMGCLVPVFAGMALAWRQRGEKRVGLTWVGDGATRTETFHEGVNLAAVLRLPVVYLIQNNQVALGTPVAKHSAGALGALAGAYGAHGEACDGNNVLDVHATAALAVERCRKGGGPVLLLAETFRMGGHATHDEAEARALFAPEQFRYWGARDPIGTFEAYLVEDGPSLDGRRRTGKTRREAHRRILGEVEAQVTAEVEAAAEEALESRRSRMPEPIDAGRGVTAGEAGAAPAGGGDGGGAAPGVRRRSTPAGSARPTSGRRKPRRRVS
jgi:TPP-dependent pyruvate/acetoin dehydrogenase alpha subunit